MMDWIKKSKVKGQIKLCFDLCLLFFSAFEVLLATKNSFSQFTIHC